MHRGAQRTNGTRRWRKAGSQRRRKRVWKPCARSPWRSLGWMIFPQKISRVGGISHLTQGIRKKIKTRHPRSGRRSLIAPQRLDFVSDPVIQQPPLNVREHGHQGKGGAGPQHLPLFIVGRGKHVNNGRHSFAQDLLPTFRILSRTGEIACPQQDCWLKGQADWISCNPQNMDKQPRAA